jgi:hypothetical protein
VNVQPSSHKDSEDHRQTPTSVGPWGIATVWRRSSIDLEVLALISS